ncbi:putative phage-related membrane protein [Escherichia coli M605]|nr:putative phage-related membrane protein [Escherichia coli M605]
MPDDVIYFANYFYVPQGVTAIISALFVRFFIRRIPFLGG